jgi:hypothetical protein
MASRAVFVAIAVEKISLLLHSKSSKWVLIAVLTYGAGKSHKFF